MTSESEIMQLEREFWTAMADGKHTVAASLLAGRAAMIGTMGFHSFTPDDYVRMSAGSAYKIIDWSFGDEQVIFPTPDSAVCYYKVRQTVEHAGRQETTDNLDTSVWVKQSGGWRCIFHTEMPASNVKSA